MAGIRSGVVSGMVMAGVLAASALGAEVVELREIFRAGETVKARVEMTAKGQYFPLARPGEAKAKGLALRSETRVEFLERVTKRDAEGKAARSVRRLLSAGSGVNVGERPTTTTVRASVALQVAELRDGVVVYCPLGPLTRPELDLVQGPGDPLALGGLLPEKAVKVGDHWDVGAEAVRGLTSYDAVSKSTLQGTLEKIDDETATVRLAGDVTGSVLGAEGTMACEGTFRFDRKGGRVDRLTLRRAETRAHGEVEGGLDVKSTLTVTRDPAETPKELADASIARYAPEGEADPSKELLLLKTADGRGTLRHDRDWYIDAEDVRQVVLKRLDKGGKLVAQCNLLTGPKVGKGKHQDPEQFRGDVKKGLGTRFVQFLGAGELEGEGEGAFRYKVGVQGRQGDLGIIWYYYLNASPQGDQLLATFTMAEGKREAFGDQDEMLMKTLRWVGEGEAGGVAPPR